MSTSQFVYLVIPSLWLVKRCSPDPDRSSGSAGKPCLQRMFEEASSTSTRRRGLRGPCARWQPEGKLVCSIGGRCRDQPDARISRLDSTAQKMFGAGVVFEAIVVLAVNIRSDGTWDVVRLTSPSVGGSGAACGQSPEVKPAKKPGVTGAKGSSGAISGPR